MKKIIQKIINISLRIYLAIFIFSVSPMLLFAGGDAQNSSIFESPIGPDDLISFVDDVVRIVTQLAAVVVVVAIVYSGFKFIMAQGIPEELTKARKILLWSLVGAVIIFGASTLRGVVCQTAKKFSDKIQCEK